MTDLDFWDLIAAIRAATGDKPAEAAEYATELLERRDTYWSDDTCH